MRVWLRGGLSRIATYPIHSWNCASLTRCLGLSEGIPPISRNVWRSMGQLEVQRSQGSELLPLCGPLGGEGQMLPLRAHGRCKMSCQA